MLNLDTKLKLDKETIGSANLCDSFTAEELQRIGAHVYDGYLRDKQSRGKWERRNEAAMDLAMQVQKEKSFPWPGCSNVAFPLVTIAALQFHSRCYAAIIDGPDVVKCRVIGPDDGGEKRARADRISCHMSWQVLEQDRSWEEQHDRLLINLPIIGTAFKKSYYKPLVAHNVSDLVLARDLVMDYWAKSTEDCPRKTHIIPLFRNDLHERIARKVFRDVSDEAWYKQPPAMQDRGLQQVGKDNRQGVTPPMGDETTPFTCLEQHVSLDLDQDGYAEPYIITIEETSKCTMRIVTRFDRMEDIETTASGEVIAIRPMEYFTKYTFIPSPDGGIYDVGFGVLLGPLNESANSLINQLIDAGTMAVAAGGFLGRGAKIRGGVYTFAPLEWKRVDSTGDDLRKSIVPLEVREPNMVLFQLLSLLINYVNRVAGTTDPLVGESTGQNTPAETTRSMVQQGMKIYNAVFKRVWRNMKDEFKKLYVLNGLYMPIRSSYGEKGQYARREDYLGSPEEVVPAADPNITSEQERIQLAATVKQSAMSTPGYDMDEVERRWLKALHVDGIEQVFPGVKKTGAPKDIKLQIQELKSQQSQAELQAEQQQFVIQMQEEMRVNSADIAKIAAEIENMKETTEGDKGDRQVAILQSVMKMLDTKNQHTLGMLDIVKKKLEIRREQVKARADNAGDVGGLEATSSNRGADAGARGEAARV